MDTAGNQVSLSRFIDEVSHANFDKGSIDKSYIADGTRVNRVTIKPTNRRQITFALRSDIARRWNNISLFSILVCKIF